MLASTAWTLLKVDFERRMFSIKNRTAAADQDTISSLLVGRFGLKSQGLREFRLRNIEMVG